MTSRKLGNKGIGSTQTVTVKKKRQTTRNLFEQSLDRQLRRAKVNFKYETERIPYVIAAHYIPDWVINTPTGVVYVEGKGYFRPEAKRKMLAVKRQHPEKDIRIVFYAFKKKDIAWATRNGFKYAIKRIPKDWLDGF